MHVDDRVLHPASGPVDLDLDATGRAQRSTVLVHADEPGWEQPIDSVTGCLPVRIVVAERSTVPDWLDSWADVVLCRPGLSAGGVECDDPVAAADAFAARVDESAVSALTLAWLLRTEAYRTVSSGLAAESAAYSTLLGSGRFRDWLAARTSPRPSDVLERVRFSLEGDLLHITLARSGRRNAVDTHMRKALVDALQIAQLDPTVRVLIDADGPSFSAGGDLDEFGSATDLGIAHLVRVGAGVGQVLHDLADRVTVRVQGACVGAGIELPAFAGHIVAEDDAVFGLPEVAMGLIPGAGGTVSIPRRIGRGRTFWLAVSGVHLDVETALAWGLVDARV